MKAAAVAVMGKGVTPAGEIEIKDKIEGGGKRDIEINEDEDKGVINKTDANMIMNKNTNKKSEKTKTKRMKEVNENENEVDEKKNEGRGEDVVNEGKKSGDGEGGRSGSLTLDSGERIMKEVNGLKVEISELAKRKGVMVVDVDGSSIQCEKCNMWVYLLDGEVLLDDEVKQGRYICGRCKEYEGLKSDHQRLVNDRISLMDEVFVRNMVIEELEDRVKRLKVERSNEETMREHSYAEVVNKYNRSKVGEIVERVINDMEMLEIGNTSKVEGRERENEGWVEKEEKQEKKNKCDENWVLVGKMNKKKGIREMKSDQGRKPMLIKKGGGWTVKHLNEKEREKIEGERLEEIREEDIEEEGNKNDENDMSEGAVGGVIDGNKGKDDEKVERDVKDKEKDNTEEDVKDKDMDVRPKVKKVMTEDKKEYGNEKTDTEDRDIEELEEEERTRIRVNDIEKRLKEIRMREQVSEGREEEGGGCGGTEERSGGGESRIVTKGYKVLGREKGAEREKKEGDGKEREDGHPRMKESRVEMGKETKVDERYEMLVVGDSIVRDLKEHVWVQGVLEVECLPGRGLKVIVEKMLECFDRVKQDGYIVLQVGGNRIEADGVENSLNWVNEGIRMIRSIRGDIKIAVVPITPRTGRRYGVWYNRVRKEINEGIRGMMKNMGNTMEMGEDEMNWVSWLGDDGVHLTEEGMRQLGLQIKRWYGVSKEGYDENRRRRY